MKLYIRSARDFSDGTIKRFSELTKGQQDKIVKQSIPTAEKSDVYQKEIWRYGDVDIYDFVQDMLLECDPECVIYKGRKKAELLDVIF